MSKSDPTKNANAPEHANAKGRSQTAAAAAPAATGASQLAIFESAMKLFHQRQFQQACERFAEAAKGPDRSIANRARLHLSMCEQRIGQAAVSLRTTEDYYNYAVALINTRKLADARAHLEKALEMSPDADHVHYALALAQALDGDTANAQKHLRRAIEIEPRNRLIARQDTDFAPLLNQPPFDALIFPDKKNW